MFLGENVKRFRRIGKTPVAFEYVGKGVPLDFDLEPFVPTRRHEHVEITRIGDDAVDRTFLAPKFAAHDAHPHAIVIDDLGNLASLDVDLTPFEGDDLGLGAPARDVRELHDGP